MIDPTAFIHPSAYVEEGAEIGAGTKVWQFATVRRGASVGAQCVIGQGAFIDAGVVLGNKCKIENYASLHRGAVLEDEVFLGPGVILTNDRWPRSTTPAGELKGLDDWRCEPVTLRHRASVGARAVLLPGVVIGENAMVGAGAVVISDVEPWSIVVGSPAKLLRVVDPSERGTL